MRSAIHTLTAGIRINPALLADAEAKAQREGMTFSELVRQAVRREIREACQATLQLRGGCGRL